MPYVAAVWLLAGMTSSALAQEPGTAPVPPEVTALAGCWEGAGSVLEKPVSITLAAKSITARALFLIEVENVALADPSDRYAAHLIFGGKTPVGGSEETIMGVYADTFGGDGMAVGLGSVRINGFEVAYAYPNASFINRWTVEPSALSWSITATDEAGSEKPFASYELTRAECVGS